MQDSLIVLFGLTMLGVSASNRIKTHIRILSLQGVLLFFICYFGVKTSLFNFIFILLETLLVKAIVIPLFLDKILKKNKAYFEDQAYIPKFYTLALASLILFTGFIISSISSPVFKSINTLYFGISIATIIISLFLITTGKKILSCLIGYMLMENGIFLLSLSVVKEMPLIISLGIFLDLFIAIFILGLLINKINQVFYENQALKDESDDD